MNRDLRKIFQIRTLPNNGDDESSEMTKADMIELVRGLSEPYKMRGIGMSYSIEIYVGAYIVAMIEPIVIKRKTLSCKLHSDKSFDDTLIYCPFCGQKLSVLIENKSCYPHIDDVLPRPHIDTLLHAAFDTSNYDTMIFIGNQKEDGWMEDVGTIEITLEMIDLTLNKFKKKYEEVIAILKQRTKSLEIRFGVVRYIM